VASSAFESIKGVYRPKKNPKRKKLINDVQAAITTGKPRTGSQNLTATNTTNNARKGRTYSIITAKNGVYHDYGNGEKVFVKKDPKKVKRNLY